MRKTLSAAAVALLTLTACNSTDTADAEPATAEEATPEVHDQIFDGHNSVALMYRWKKPDDDTLGVELTGWYTYDVGTPTGDGEVESHENYHGGISGDEVQYPPSSVRDFQATYISVPDGDRLWTQGRIDDDNAPDEATLECLIVSLDGEGVLAHETSENSLDPVKCEYEF